MVQAERAKELPSLGKVICVHGTAAADASDDGRRWWQSGSDFANALQTLLPEVGLDRPYHWSGENWERDRRTAGVDLLGRLLRLEAAGQPYHLVGHSHGGSVILHALRIAAAAGEDLRCLRSWTTVGTPFLSFVSSGINVPLILATTTVFAASGMVLAEVGGYLSGNTGDISIGLYSAIFGGLLILLGAFAASLAYLCVRPWFDWRHSRREEELTAKAQRIFADRWLGLWHPNDEPIGGLASTLGKAPNLAPRYFWLLARALDELVWLRITRRIQGTNLLGRELGRVGRSPFKVAWGPIPDTISDRMTERCNAASATTISSIRPLLGTAYLSQDANSFVAELKARMSWAELLHNSYFADPQILDIIALRISSFEPSMGKPASSVEPRLHEWVAIGATADATGDVLPRSRLTALNVAGSLTAAAFALLLAIATISSFRAFVAPFTDRAQIDSIVVAVENGELLNIHGNDAAGAVLGGLYRAGRLKNPIDMLEKIREPNAFVMASRSLAASYATKEDVASFNSLTKIAETQSKQISRTDLLLDFIRAAPEGSGTIEPILAEVSDLIQKRTSRQDRNGGYLALASILTVRHLDDRSSDVARKISVDTKDDLPCYDVANYVNVLMAANETDNARRILGMCETNADSRPEVWLRVARTLRSMGLQSASQKATALIAPDDKLTTEERLSLARTHVLNGDLAAASAEVERLLKADRTLPPEQMFDAGRILADSNKPEEARSAFEGAAIYADYRARFFSRVSSSMRDYGLVIKALVAAGDETEAKRLAGALIDALGDEKFDDGTKIEDTLSFAETLPQIGFGDRHDQLVAKLEKAIDTIPENQRLRVWLRLSKERSQVDKPTARKALERAVVAAGLANEYQTRSQSYSEISQKFAQLGYLRLARITADRATVPQELLKGYASVLGSLPQHPEYGENWFLSVDKERTRQFLEQAQKEGIMAFLGFGVGLHDSVSFNSDYADRICKMSAVAADLKRDPKKVGNSTSQ